MLETIRQGSSGPAVSRWQELLNATGARLIVDGDFGPATLRETLNFQRNRGLVADGVVGSKTWATAEKVSGNSDTDPAPAPPVLELPPIKFVQARNFTRARQIDLLVVHSMEAREASTTAENVAAWFAGPNAPKASAHYCLDNNSIVQCVADQDVAWHAPGANRNGLGFELAGYARQKREEWFDPFSAAMLELLSMLLAQKCEQYGIPVRFVDAEALKRGVRGITTHHEVSQAFGKSSHWDPGPSFPMDYLLERIEHHKQPRGARSV